MVKQYSDYYELVKHIILKKLSVFCVFVIGINKITYAMIKEEKSNDLSNFSIDHILNRAGQNTCTTKKYETVNGGRYFTNLRENNKMIEDRSWHRIQVDNHDVKNSGVYQQYSFQWLNCTRYQPPRLQRVIKKETVKRQPGRHPRIPFTPFQIEILETSYRNCPYLNSEEVIRLSKVLDLADARIKIWFQNRRAREKREKTGNPDEQVVLKSARNNT